ncbi:MAG: LamG domain-containing protein [Candidatus Moraniibacteriota bacterium]|nr:MAG: LamG domain-containing protein [Candidatus Moranbacteria bacterium]
MTTSRSLIRRAGVLDAVGDQYYTLSGWFNRDTATTTDTILAKSNGTADAMGYLVYLDATTDKLVFATRSALGDNTLETTSAYTAPGWHHFAIIFNIPRTGGNFGQIYIDGGIQNDNSIGGGYAGSIESTRAFVIGAESDGGNPFDGKLDEIRLYNRALSADEVAQLYRLTMPTGVDTSLKGYWSFNGSDTTGTTAYDRSGAGNNGTLTNGPTIAEGKLGQALNFDGVDDSVGITGLSFPDWQSASGYTISLWVKDFPDDLQDIVLFEMWNSGDNDERIRLGSNNYPPYQRLQVMAGRQYSQSEAYIPEYVYPSLDDTRIWHQLVVTANSSKLALFHNGVEVASDTAFTTFGSFSFDSIRIGGGASDYNGNPSNSYAGALVDEVRIYNRTLTTSEITALYNLGASDKVNTSVSQLQGTGRLDSGLAGYWKLDENTGTSAADTSTNASTGTLTNGPTWTTGRIGSAVNFDGVNDEIGVSDAPALDFGVGEAFSYAGWFNLSAVDGNEPLVMKSTNDASQGYGLFIHTTDLFNIMLNDATDDCSDYVDLNTTLTGAWHHYVWSVDTSHISRLYVDGTLRLTTDCSVSGDLSNADALSLGWMYAGTSQYFSGKQDDVRLYNRALSADEVAQLYRLTSPTGVDTSLKGYWSFNGPDVSGTTASDRSGAGNNGTLTNGPTITEGKLGQALSFDGTNDTVSISPTGLPTGSRTISVWAKAPLLDGSYRGVIGYGNQNNGEAFAIQINSSNEWVITGWGAPNAVSGGAVVLNQWTHIVGTYSGGNASIYVNGVLVGGPAAITSAPNLNYSAIGSRLDGGGDYFPGQIDEVRIYNRVLSDTEVKALYNSGR